MGEKKEEGEEPLSEFPPSEPVRYAFIVNQEKTKHPQWFASLLATKLKKAGLAVEEKEIYLDEKGEPCSPSDNFKSAIQTLVVWCPFQLMEEVAEREGFGKVVFHNEKAENQAYMLDEYRKKTRINLKIEEEENKADQYFNVEEFNAKAAKTGRYGPYSRTSRTPFFLPCEQYGVIQDVASAALRVEIDGETKVKLIADGEMVQQNYRGERSEEERKKAQEEIEKMKKKIVEEQQEEEKNRSELLRRGSTEIKRIAKQLPFKTGRENYSDSSIKDEDKDKVVLKGWVTAIPLPVAWYRKTIWKSYYSPSFTNLKRSFLAISAPIVSLTRNTLNAGDSQSTLSAILGGGASKRSSLFRSKSKEKEKEEGLKSKIKEEVTDHIPEKLKKKLDERKELQLPGSESIHAVRAYFGEKVALYFAWLETFTECLLFPAILGFFMWLYTLTSSLTVDDNPYLPFYGIGMVVWSFLFLKKWERTCAEYTYSWGSMTVENQPEFELVRPAYYGTLRVSPITHLPEIHYHRLNRMYHYLYSFVVTALLLCVTMFVMVCSFNLQGYMSAKDSIFHVETLHQFSEPGAIFDPQGPYSLGPVIIHSICIMQFNEAYSSVALWLTEKENHRSVSEFESSLILKRFFFEAFDCYIPLFYLAFYQLDAQLLRTELTGLYTSDAIRRVLTETLIPLILLSTKRIGRFFQTLINRSEAKKKKEKHIEVRLGDKVMGEVAKIDYEAFNDYLEMIIELGYITLFASAFPLAPLLSLFCNFVEIRSDMFKLLFISRKPSCERRATIGVWYQVQLGLAWASILTNCLIFGFSSEQMVSWFPSLFEDAADVLGDILPDNHEGPLLEGGRVVHEATELFREGAGRYAVGIVFVLEHLLVLVVLAIIHLISSEPKWVTDKRLRKEYVSRSLLRESHMTSQEFSDNMLLANSQLNHTDSFSGIHRHRGGAGPSPRKPDEGEEEESKKER